jgi:hypothetical protein
MRAALPGVLAMLDEAAAAPRELVADLPDPSTGGPDPPPNSGSKNNSAEGERRMETKATTRRHQPERRAFPQVRTGVNAPRTAVGEHGRAAELRRDPLG